MQFFLLSSPFACTQKQNLFDINIFVLRGDLRRMNKHTVKYAFPVLMSLKTTRPPRAKQKLLPQLRDNKWYFTFPLNEEQSHQMPNHNLQLFYGKRHLSFANSAKCLQ